MGHTHECLSAENQVKIFVPSKMTKCLVLRQKIITLHKQGLSTGAIAKRLLEPKTSVWNIVRHFKTTGRVEQNSPSPGRPRSVTTKIGGHGEEWGGPRWIIVINMCWKLWIMVILILYTNEFLVIVNTIWVFWFFILGVPIYMEDPVENPFFGSINLKRTLS